MRSDEKRGLSSKYFPMKLRHYISAFAATGVLLSLIANIFWSTYGANLSSEHDLFFLNVTLMFFPAYLGTMSMSSETGYWSFVFFGFMFYNAVFYSILGVCTWLGVYKNKLFFLIELILIAVLWYGIWVLL